MIRGLTLGPRRSSHGMAHGTQVGTIETQFRTFPLEVLGGEEDLNVSLRESGVRACACPSSWSDDLVDGWTPERAARGRHALGPNP